MVEIYKERGRVMRSVKILRKKEKFILIVVADGYSREYIEDDVEVAKARASKLKLILGIK